MVVKIQSNKIPRGFLFAAAGGAMIFITGVMMLRHHFFQPETAGCHARYARAEIFGMRDTSRGAFTIDDLQARLGGTDWGLSEHGAIIGRDDARQKLALHVKLAANVENGGTVDNPGSGLGFYWSPQSLPRAASGCLSYDVRLPADFDFGPGGVLPGLMTGRVDDPDREGDEQLALPMRWTNDGRIAVRVWRPDQRKHRDLTPKSFDGKLPLGRWFRVSQEVVLNAPGQSNGALRVWIDGDLVIEREGLSIRNNAQTVLGQLKANVHYSTRDVEWLAAPKDTGVSLSQIVVRN